MKAQIISHLSDNYPWSAHFHWFPVLDSTNDLAKQMARQGAPHGTVLIAERQTGGNGRMGRSLQSPAGVGIYLSILLRPECVPGELMHLTCAAAVAMCDAVEQIAGFRPGIKWTNDLVHEKRKLGGILTELGFTSTGKTDYAIIGIGINCCQQPGDFHPDIKDIAGSLSMAAGYTVDRARVAAAMMDALAGMDRQLLTEKASIMQRYRSDCITLGKQISVLRGDQVFHAAALSIDEDGGLIVQCDDGSLQMVNSGEVSIRGMYGYL